MQSARRRSARLEQLGGVLAMAAVIVVGRARQARTLVEFADMQCPFCADFATDEFVRDTLSAVDGLDVDKALADGEAGAATTALNEVQSLADRYRIQSTPSFLIGKTGGSLKTLEVQNLDGTQIGDAVNELAG